MPEAFPPEVDISAPQPAPDRPPRGEVGERILLLLIFLALVLLPLQEVVVLAVNDLLRALGSSHHLAGLTGSIPLTQHLVLVLGMLGAVLAARQKRLLSLSTLTTFLKGRWRTIAAVGSQAVGAAVSVFLCLGSARFVAQERQFSSTLALGIPTWIVELCLPVGFGLIALRLWWHTSERWPIRLLTGGVAGALVALAIALPVDPEKLRWPALAILGLATLLGAPLFTALGGAALILFWSSGETIAGLAVDHYQMSVNPMLPTIPLFTLTGYLLAEGGASRRLVRVFQAWVGHLRGGEAMLTVLVCAFFTSFTGASGVTILALGGLLLPVLTAARYRREDALGLLTGSGSIGLLFPPCIPLILYAIVASEIQKNLGSSIGTALPPLDAGSLDTLSLEDLQKAVSAGAGAAPREISIEAMFLAGIVPGLLMVVLACLWGWRLARRAGKPSRPFEAREAWQSLRGAFWELLTPVVALVSIFGGFASIVQAAAITAAYAFFVEVVIYRDLKIGRDLPRVFADCGVLIGGVLIILGVAQGFNNYLINEEVPQQLLAWVQSSVHSPLLFLLLLNLFLLVVGCLMDIYSAIIVVVPMIVPIGLAFGVDPVHLGIIFLANLELGYLTPPVGINLILSAYRFEVPILQVARYALPMFVVLLIGVLLITYCPPLTTWLPGWLLP